MRWAQGQALRVLVGNTVGKPVWSPHTRAVGVAVAAPEGTSGKAGEHFLVTRRLSLALIRAEVTANVSVFSLDKGRGLNLLTLVSLAASTSEYEEKRKEAGAYSFPTPPDDSYSREHFLVCSRGGKWSSMAEAS